MRTGLRWLIAGTGSFAGALVSAPAAFAHLEGTVGGGMAAGLLHPLGGADHVLAMIAVGLWAAQRGGALRWRLPAAFVAAMLAGGALALAGVVLPGVEWGIAASVVLLGALICGAPHLSGRSALALVAGAALLHGQAHGQVLAAGLSPALFAMGLVAATAALHAVGVAAGAALLRTRLPAGAMALRAGGAAIALAGGVLVTGLL